MNKLENITNNEMRIVIDEYIHKERDRAIMKRRLCDGICFEPLAEEFDLSVKQVKNIIYKNQDVDVNTLVSELKKNIPKDGVKIDIPIIGTMIFHRDDVDKLYEHITAQED